MKEIKIAGEAACKVDDADWHLVHDLKWHLLTAAPNHVYAASGKGNRILMHRLITGAEKGVVVDHINGDCLDNRRSNLRLCTRRENLCNRKRASNSTQPYKGVHKFKRGSRWGASVRCNGIRKLLGGFATAEEAAIAYDAAAIAAFGEFACLNFPHMHPEFAYRAADPSAHLRKVG